MPAAPIRYTHAVRNPLQPGDIIERYRVESTLGEGGTARVYRVRHTALDTVHALKVLTIDHPKLRGRLMAEGKAQAALNHPNLVPVRDVIDIGGTPALLMDFVAGQSLDVLLHHGLPPPHEALRLFIGIATGVAYAHARGFVHRDLKPANVLLDQTAHPSIPRVTDFGLVRVLREPSGQERRTAVGVMMGTPGYMAPEQLRDSHTADQRTDVFALGALLYTLATGEAPFSGPDQLDVMNATAEARYVRLRDRVQTDANGRFDAVIDRCLRVDPAARYPTIDALLQDLDPAPTPLVSNQTLDWDRGSPMHEPTVGDDAPNQAPTRIDAAPATKHPTALIVDEQGTGFTVQISVHLDPNGTDMVSPPNISRDTAVAAQISASVALGARANRIGVRWGFRGFSAEVRGTSLGLPLAVAIWCAHHGRTVPAGVAFTGGLDMDGRIAAVSGLPAKLRAAATNGFRTVLVPAHGQGRCAAPDGLNVVPVETFDAAIRALFDASGGSKTRILRWESGLFLIPVLLAITGLTSAIEPMLIDPVLRVSHGALPADNTAIVAFPPQRDARALRATHPATIDALVASGVKSIFFDVIMLAETNDDDALAAAIDRANAAGVPVILPLMTENEQVLHPESDALRAAARFGAVLAQADTTFWQVRRAPMRVHSIDGGAFWHAAVQTVRAHLNVDAQPSIRDGVLQVGPNRNPVWADLAYLHPTEASPIVEYGDLDAYRELQGRSILIGEMGGADDVHRVASGAVYGVQIEAALIETLLQQRAPRMVRPEVNAGFSLLIGLCTAWLGMAVPYRLRGLAWVVPLAGLAIGLTLVASSVLIALIPMIVASTIGLWFSQRCHPETNAHRNPSTTAS